MPHTFRFSPKPNRASRIAWQPWTRAAFDEAASRGTPVLLSISAVWSRHSHIMDETAWSDEAVHALVRDRFTAVRVDADREPHVFGRYGAGAVPTTAFLTPTGEVLWADTVVDAASLIAVAGSVLDAWSARREELELEIARRRIALDTARAQRQSLGLVRRDAADEILNALRTGFDHHTAAFGGDVGVPRPRAVELIYARAAGSSDLAIADRVLDAMAAGEIHDTSSGGFYRAAAAPGWLAPDGAKLLASNAALLEAYALGAVTRGRADWAEVARGIVRCVEAELAQDGLYRASDAACGDTGGEADDACYTDGNAQWIRALASAGARLGLDAWIDRAEDAFSELLRRRRDAHGLIGHCDMPDGSSVMLADALHCLQAALVLAQATGTAQWLETARALARSMQVTFWAVDGGFHDRVSNDDDVGALRYPERHFEQNAVAARALLDLAHITAERTWRGLAERTLSSIGANAVRYGADASDFALAVDAYFVAPPTVIIAAADAASRETAALRRAAFRLPLPKLRVWTVPSPHRIGPHEFDAGGSSAAYLWTSRGCSPAVFAADGLARLDLRAR